MSVSSTTADLTLSILRGRVEVNLSKKYHNLADFVLSDPDFFVWSGSGSPNKHHYGKHRLLIHTAEVVDLCLSNAQILNHYSFDKDVLILAALFHDIGKLRDYKPTNDELTEWEKTSHARNIHHVNMSTIIWNFIYHEKYGGDDYEFVDKVTHCILSHHGERAWGSPIQPNTREAWLLHLCDSISTKMNDCLIFDYAK